MEPSRGSSEPEFITKELEKVHLKKKQYFLRKIFQFGQKHRDHGPIQVHRKPASSASNGEVYETELHEQLADVEAASEFFTLLDLQLNMVNQFYKTKESEFLERWESLRQQMEILIELKTALKQKRERGAQPNELNTDSPSISCHISCEESIVDGNTEETDMEGIQFTESSRTDETETSRRIIRDHSSSKGLSGQVFICRGKSITIKIPLTNPSRTFSAISYLLREDLVNQSNKCSTSGTKLHVSKTKLHQAEKMIRGALIELYKGLGYLKTYRSLNMIGFAKVLEKFDKVSNKEVTPIYLKVVESSYINNSEKVMRLADEVEDLFVKYFTEGDHKKAMKYLKPNHRKESHAVTFFTGLFTGCFLALLVGYIIMAHIAGMYTQPYDSVYMETVYPVLRQAPFSIILYV